MPERSIAPALKDGPGQASGLSTASHGQWRCKVRARPVIPTLSTTLKDCSTERHRHGSVGSGRGKKQCLLLKHETFRSQPPSHVAQTFELSSEGKVWGWQCPPVMPAQMGVGRQGQADPYSSLAVNLAKSVNSQFSERPNPDK